MKNTEITVVAYDNPAVLERILRVIRHRGFCLTNLQMKATEDKIWCDIQLSSNREIHLLINQLAKLHDVIDVTNCEE